MKFWKVVLTFVSLNDITKDSNSFSLVQNAVLNSSPVRYITGCRHCIRQA